MSDLTISQVFDLSGKVALVTGGALGIGEGIARRLAEAGAAVMISDINLEAVQEAVKKIREAGGTAEAVRSDVSRLEDVQKATDATVEKFGKLDILVNNAGIFPSKPVLDVSPELWQKVISTNLSGAFFQAQAAARKMVASGQGGKIINIASIDALHPSGNLVHYDASKGGVAMLTRSMALELAKHHITVNAIAPGGVQTPGASMTMDVGSLSSTQVEIMVRDFMARIPLGRMGVPDDIAKPVLFLASSAADYITGELIVVDGGFLLS